MARPRKHRRIHCNPAAYYFKPRGVPMNLLSEVILQHDELESLRLADILNLSHEESAEKMNVSRATFGRIISTARQKVADGILNGKAIKIDKNPEEFSVNHKVKYCRGCGRDLSSN